MPTAQFPGNLRLYYEDDDYHGSMGGIGDRLSASRQCEEFPTAGTPGSHS